MIEFQNVIPEYLEQEKVQRSEIWGRRISFSAKHTHLVAPSGRGKTSLIHFLYGLRYDYTGSIQYDNRDIKSFSREEISQLRSQKVSIVFQDLRLFPEHTALQNISVKRDLNPYRENRIREMAAMLGVENKLNQPARHCSYGEQQRIAIIRSLQQPFKMLILDEPFSHLDQRNSEIAMKLITQEAAEREASILLLDLDIVPFFPADEIFHL